MKGHAIEPLVYKRRGFWSLPEEYVRSELRARPPCWEERWPREPAVVAIRNRVSRLFSFHCNWPNVAFLPEDELCMLCMVVSEDDCDLAELATEIENLFAIEITEKNCPGSMTYIEFIEFILANGRIDMQSADRKAFKPFRLPDDYLKRGGLREIARLIPLVGSDRRKSRAMRARQVHRTDVWREYWPKNESITAVRDRISPVLVAELDWFDESFVPEDRVDALLLARSGLKSTANAVNAINEMFPNRHYSPEVLAVSAKTYVEWIGELVR